MILTSDFIQSGIFQLNGDTLKLPRDRMKHLYPIYNEPSNIKLFKFARQTHKSTTIGYHLLIPVLKYQNFHCLYIAPTGNQVSVFSTDKLDGAIKSSPLICEHYVTSKQKAQISYKEFSNNSKIYLRSCYRTPDSSRGISADFICFDEFQDLISEHIPVLEQCMSHSLAHYDYLSLSVPNLPLHLFNSRIYAGTPKTKEGVMEKYYDKMEQREFLIQCKHCGTIKSGGRWNYIDIKNVGKEQLICRYCGKPIWYEHGIWFKIQDAYKPGMGIAYRLPQIILPWINNRKRQENWKINVITPREIYTTEKYYNEILALPYSAGRHPITEQMLRVCCNNHGESYNMIKPNEAVNNKFMRDADIITAGIDWGKGDTCRGTSYSALTIGMFKYGRFYTLYQKRYTGAESEATWQIKDMLRTIRLFGCHLTIADTGDGRTSNAIMVNELTTRKFAEVYEHGTIKQKIKWDSETGKYIFNRTQIMTDYIMGLKRRQSIFYNWNEFKEFSDDYTGIFSEYSERTRLTKYDHLVPDDTFHSWMFAQLAAYIKVGKYRKFLIGGM